MEIKGYVRRFCSIFLIACLIFNIMPINIDIALADSNPEVVENSKEIESPEEIESPKETEKPEEQENKITFSVTLYGNGGNIMYEGKNEKNITITSITSDNTNTLPTPTGATSEDITWNFKGWSRSKEAKTVDVQSDATFKSLNAIDGDNVSLFAVWEVKDTLTGEEYYTSVQNGSFEKPKITSGFYQLFDCTSSVKEELQWKTTASDHKIELGTPNSAYNVNKVSHGDQFAEINANIEAALYQTIATTKDSVYLWSLDHHARRSEDEQMEVWIGPKEQVAEALEAYKIDGNKVGDKTKVAFTKYPNTLYRYDTLLGGSDGVKSPYKKASMTGWQTHKGIYTSKSDGLITFAFVSAYTTKASEGNVLDNITFTSTPTIVPFEYSVKNNSGGTLEVKTPKGETKEVKENETYKGTVEEMYYNTPSIDIVPKPAEGYTFIGAIEEGEFIKADDYNPSHTLNVGNGLDINMIYIKNSLVKLELNDGDIANGLTENILKIGDKYTAPIPTREGYVFCGWKIKGGVENSTEDNLTESNSTVDNEFITEADDKITVSYKSNVTGEENIDVTTNLEVKVLNSDGTEKTTYNPYGTKSTNLDEVKQITLSAIWKKALQVPDPGAKAYTGNALKSDIKSTDDSYYTVTVNESGIEVGEYKVEYTVKDTVNLTTDAWENKTTAVDGVEGSTSGQDVVISEDGKTATVKFRITQVENSFTSWDDATNSPIICNDFEYDGEKSASAYAETHFGNNENMVYTYYKDKGATRPTTIEDGAVSETSAPKNAGTYYVKAYMPGTANYKEIWAIKEFEIKGASQPAPSVNNGRRFLELDSEDMITKADETIDGKSDGIINNVNDTMEYCKQTGTDSEENPIYGPWISVSEGETTVNNLSAGMYQIRYKAKTNYVAGEPALVMINEGEKLVLTFIAIGCDDNVLSRQTIEASWNSNINAAKAPTRTGYKFIKWLHENETNTVVSEGVITGIQEDATYKAVYEKELSKPVEPISDSSKPEDKGTIATDVKVDDNATETDINNLDVDLARRLLSDDEIKAVDTGEDILIYLEVKNINNSINSNSKELIKNEIDEQVEKFAKEEGLKSSDKVTTGVEYLDLSLFKKIGENDSTRLYETGDAPLEVTIEIPENLKAKGKKRTYCVIRLHEVVGTGRNEIDALPTVYNAENETLTFKTNKFSPYAIVYTEYTENENNSGGTNSSDNNKVNKNNGKAKNSDNNKAKSNKNIKNMNSKNSSSKGSGSNSNSKSNSKSNSNNINATTNTNKSITSKGTDSNKSNIELLEATSSSKVKNTKNGKNSIESPKTGDENNLRRWIMYLFISSVVIIAMIKKRKRIYK